MKKTVLKRIACAVLSAILILTPVVSGYAAGMESKIPIVHVRGVGEEIYKNPGTDKQEAVFPPSTQAILKLVGQISLPLGKLAATRDWDAFAYSHSLKMKPVYLSEYEHCVLQNGGKLSSELIETLRENMIIVEDESHILNVVHFIYGY